MNAQDETAFSDAITAAELVSKGDPEGALLLLGESSVDPRHLRRAALVAFSYVMSGEHSAERFNDMRGALFGLADADGTNVTLELEVVGAAELLERGDPAGVDAIVSGSTFAPFAFAWTAAALAGQAVRGWLGADQLPAFWNAVRRQYGVEGAA